METLETKTIKDEITEEQLRKNLHFIEDEINDVIEENNWVIKTNGEINTAIVFDNYMVNSYDSKNKRKNVAKAMYKVQKKMTLRGINLYFYKLRQLGVIATNVKVEPSLKEQAIIQKRKLFRDAQVTFLKTLKDYKKEKGNFYKK